MVTREKLKDKLIYSALSLIIGIEIFGVAILVILGFISLVTFPVFIMVKIIAALADLF